MKKIKFKIPCKSILTIIFIFLATPFPLHANECPKYTGLFSCPAMPGLKYPQPPYKIYVNTENDNDILIYKSRLSISPEKESIIIADGKEHSSIDNKGITRSYVANCTDGVLTNRYSLAEEIAETKIWVTKTGDLNILYDFAHGHILTCSKIAL